jgi:hypothetical protein
MKNPAGPLWARRVAAGESLFPLTGIAMRLKS